MQKQVYPLRFMGRMLFGGMIGGICWGMVYYLILWGSGFMSGFTTSYFPQFVSVGWILGFIISFLTAMMLIFITNGKNYSQKSIHITIFMMVILTSCPSFFVFYSFSPSPDHLLLHYVVIIVGQYFLMRFSLYKKSPPQNNFGEGMRG